MSRGRIPETVIEEAKRIDLLSYFLSTIPGEVVRCGVHEFCLKEHDSLKMSNGKWFWWSRGVGGNNAIDYLMKVDGMDFISAVRKVSNKAIALPPTNTVKQKTYKRAFELPPHNFVCRCARAYLISRGIDKNLIDTLIGKHLIAEDNKSRAVMFMGLDDAGTPKHCSIRATNGTSFKMDAPGSDKRYTFRLLSENNCGTLRVFESAIDLLSFVTILLAKELDYRKYNLLSLSGVYGKRENDVEYHVPPSVETFLKAHPEVQKIYLHFDNDDAGKSAAAGFQSALGDKYEVRYLPAPHGKDMNDYLMYVHSIRTIQKGLHNEQVQKEKEI